MRLLIVCQANLCRSPLAEAVVRSHIDKAGLASRLQVASAGISAALAGEKADYRARRVAGNRGYRLAGKRARAIAADDFLQFDLIVAMDRGVLDRLEAMRPIGSRARLALFLDFAGALPIRDVPDPYYGGIEGFERVLDLCEEAAGGLVAACAESFAIPST